MVLTISASFLKQEEQVFEGPHPTVPALVVSVLFLRLAHDVAVLAACSFSPESMPVCVCLIHFPTDVHLHCFQYLAVKSNKYFCKCFYKNSCTSLSFIGFFFFFGEGGKYLNVELLSDAGTLCLAF